MTAAMRLHAYSVVGDLIDEKLGMADSTLQESMLRFCDAVITCFEHDYLRALTDTDVIRIL